MSFLIKGIGTTLNFVAEKTGAIAATKAVIGFLPAGMTRARIAPPPKQPTPAVAPVVKPPPTTFDSPNLSENEMVLKLIYECYKVMTDTLNELILFLEKDASLIVPSSSSSPKQTDDSDAFRARLIQLSTGTGSLNSPPASTSVSTTTPPVKKKVDSTRLFDVVFVDNSFGIQNDIQVKRNIAGTQFVTVLDSYSKNTIGRLKTSGFVLIILEETYLKSKNQTMTERIAAMVTLFSSPLKDTPNETPKEVPKVAVFFKPTTIESELNTFSTKLDEIIPVMVANYIPGRVAATYPSTEDWMTYLIQNVLPESSTGV